MKVVYIAGPFRADNAWEIEQNVRSAEELALQVWRMGAAVICPHANTRFFDGAADDGLWLRGDVEILKRCDAVLVVPNSGMSRGTATEIEVAKVYNIPVFKNLLAIREWLNGH